MIGKEAYARRMKRPEAAVCVGWICSSSPRSRASSSQGAGGLRHSDTAMITGTGYETLTRPPVALAELAVLARRPLARLKGAIVRRAMGV